MGRDETEKTYEICERVVGDLLLTTGPNFLPAKRVRLPALFILVNNAARTIFIFILSGNSETSDNHRHRRTTPISRTDTNRREYLK